MLDGKYSVMVDNTTIAENMDIKTALILVGALMEEYYMENSLRISIVRDWKDGGQDAGRAD